MEALCLVIIEDEDAHFSLMKRAILRDMPDASVHNFKDAGSCLKRLDEITPDVIITDYLMPGLNGIQLLETMNQEKREIPVIMITGQGDENIAVRCIKLGAADYIVKSANFAALLPGAIERIVRERGLREELIESEERFRRVIEKAPFGYSLLGVDGLWKYVNPQWERMHGYSFEEVNNRSFEITRPEHEKERDREYFKKAICGKNVSGEMARKRKDGSIEYHSFYFQPVYHHGKIVGVDAFIIDLTARRRAEEHVHRLSQQILKAQENERHKISRELHDSVVQDLSSLRIKFENLFNNLPDELTLKISDFSGTLRDSIAAVRGMAYDLLPPILDQLGLFPAVSQFCDEFSEKTGLSVDFHSAGMDGLRLDFDSEINLYRLIQEGLNNINKHAGGANVAVRLVSSFPNIILRIQDDGKGFDVKERILRASDEKRMGLQSMKERVALLQGKMRVQSRPGKGTKIYIEIPYEEKKSGSKKEHPDN